MVEVLIVGSVFNEIIEGREFYEIPEKYIKISASMSQKAMTSLVSGKLPKNIVANTELLLARTYL